MPGAPALRGGRREALRRSLTARSGDYQLALLRAYTHMKNDGINIAIVSDLVSIGS